jgi:hypothetical protein
VFQP